jgi:hypothetical protein
MVRAAWTGSVKKLGVLGAIIVASALLDMCAELYLHYQHYTDALYPVAREISDAMEFVFPNSLYILLSIVGVPHIAFSVLIGIPLAYACSIGVEKLRRRYGFVRAACAYAVASFALYLFFVFLFFRIVF